MPRGIEGLCPKRYVDGKPTKAYRSWKAMKQRCDPSYSLAWRYTKYHEMEHEKRLLEDFDYFYEVLGPRPEGTTLDRIDNDRGYWSDNIRWATLSEQNLNNNYTRSK